MRRRWGVTEEQVRKRIKQFKINARGADYVPYVLVRDVPSLGRSSIVKGLITLRNHHLFSDLEYFHFILLESSASVVDIREHYPLLPREETIEIANELGIKHPVYPGSNTPIVMTTDIVPVVMRSGVEHELPMSIKYSSSLRGVGSKTAAKKIGRTIEKLQIELHYWRRRGLHLSVCTEVTLPKNRVRNLDDLRVTMVAEECDYLNVLLFKFAEYFEAAWTPGKWLKCLLAEVASQLSLSLPETRVLFGRAVWLGVLIVDLDSTKLLDEFPIRFSDHHSQIRTYSDTKRETLCEPIRSYQQKNKVG